jgi:hypothetical protein
MHSNLHGVLENRPWSTKSEEVSLCGHGNSLSVPEGYLGATEAQLGSKENHL